MALPADPAAFVVAAEHAINRYDLGATVDVYAPSAQLEAITDGAREVHRGRPAIHCAWDGYLGAMRRRRFRLHKTLIATDDATIVNSWTGSLGGHTDARGIEYWRFDDSGDVEEHHMYSLLNVKPSASALARLRLAVAYPLSALAFLREQRRSERIAP